MRTVKFLRQALVAQVGEAHLNSSYRMGVDKTLKFDSTKYARRTTPQSRSNAASASNGPLTQQSWSSAASVSSRLPSACAPPPPAPKRPPPSPAPPLPPPAAHEEDIERSDEAAKLNEDHEWTPLEDAIVEENKVMWWLQKS